MTDVADFYSDRDDAEMLLDTDPHDVVSEVLSCRYSHDWPETLIIGLLFPLCVLSVIGWHSSARGADCNSPTHCALMRMPVHETDVDEPSADRRARLAEVSEAIDGATRDIRRRAALVTLVRFESSGARYVHEGRCSDGPRGEKECDSGRAKGHWQLHGTESFVIPDDMTEQARIASSRWGGSLRECGTVDGAFARYGRGHGCESTGWAKRRREYMASVEAALWRSR